MEYFTLNNGVKMPALGLGTYKIKGDPAQTECAVHDALNAGYRLFDTAAMYGNEGELSTALKSADVPREDLFLTTKVWFTNFEEEACRQSLENSFRLLQTDYLDLVLLHWPYGNVYTAWRVLEEYYKAGRIRAIGVSNMSPYRLVDLVKFNEIVPAVDQVETNLYCQRQDWHKWYEKYHVVHQAYAPLGRAKLQEAAKEPAVQNLMKKYNKSAAQIVLKFLIQCGISAIPKSTHKERIEENVKLFDFTLDEVELESLRALDRKTPQVGRPEDAEWVEDFIN